MIERVSLSPRQSLALVEADGIRMLVATSPDASVTFFPLCKAAQSDVAKEAPRAMENPWATGVKAAAPGARHSLAGSLKQGRVSW